MKKIVKAMLLLSLSAAALSGCTEINTPAAVSSMPESSTEEIPSAVESVTEESSEISKEESQELSESEESSKEDSENENSEDSQEESQESSKSEESSKEDSKEDSKDSSEEDSETENSAENSDEESKEDDSIFSFKIRLNGIDYQLPFAYEELAQLGYYFDKDGELEAEKYTLGVNPKNENGDTINAQLWNPSDKTKDYTECEIGSIEIKLGDGIDVVLPGEFVFDDTVTPEAVKEQYGEPESEHISEKYVTLRYKIDFYRTVEFFIYTDETMTDYTSVTVKNFS